MRSSSSRCALAWVVEPKDAPGEGIGLADCPNRCIDFVQAFRILRYINNRKRSGGFGVERLSGDLVLVKGAVGEPLFEQRHDYVFAQGIDGRGAMKV